MSPTAFAELLEADLEEARQMLQRGHNEMALVRAVASFEWFMKHAFIEPYLRASAIEPNTELADLMVNVLLRRPNGWSDVSRLLSAFWDIDTGRLPGWQHFTDSYRMRSQIVHNGLRCGKADARAAIDNCSTLLRALLIARIEARAQLADEEERRHDPHTPSRPTAKSQHSESR